MSFLAVGDTLLTRRVERAIAKSGDPFFPFRSAAALLESVDFTFANIESPLKVDTAIAGLVQGRIHMVNLANNHIMDGGLERLLLTRNRLNQAGVKAVGVGSDLEEAWTAATITVHGVRIGFVGASYTSKNSSRMVRLPYVARIDHRFALRDSVKALRGQVDFVVAAMHAGVEYVTFPAAEQIQFAHSAIESGADLVIGTHPHVVQRTEKYRDRYIFHSLGNFVFDQERPKTVLESAAVRVTLRTEDGALARLEVVPMVNPDTLSPQVAPEGVKRRILSRMGLKEAVLVNHTSP